jgi:hypothetical protein
MQCGQNRSAKEKFVNWKKIAGRHSRAVGAKSCSPNQRRRSCYTFITLAPPASRLGNVKKAETRARKIAEFVAMLERGETIHG